MNLFIILINCAMLMTLVGAFQYRSSKYAARNILQRARGTVRCYAGVGGNRWEEFETLKPRILGPSAVFNHLGDDFAAPSHRYPKENDVEEKKKQNEFRLNVGKALNTLQRELPMVFYVSNLDFSIFASHITVADGNRNKIMMQKTLYTTAIKSLKMASGFSSICPSMNVRKIEYVEDCRTIQCLVDVVLPDTVRVDGQAVWEGMFYFGLNSEGLIDTHIFDRKISTLRPSTPSNTRSYPWFTAYPSWATSDAGELLAPSPAPTYSSLAERILESIGAHSPQSTKENTSTETESSHPRAAILEILQQQHNK